MSKLSSFDKSSARKRPLYRLELKNLENFGEFFVVENSLKKHEDVLR